MERVTARNRRKANGIQDGLGRVRLEYLRERVEEQGGHRAFARATGIARANVTRALNGSGGLSDGMIARIAATIGPSAPDIYELLAKRLEENKAA